MLIGVWGRRSAHFTRRAAGSALRIPPPATSRCDTSLGIETVHHRIIAYLAKTRYPMRRKLGVVASILGISISEITVAADALERAGRLTVDRWKGSLILTTVDPPKGSMTSKEL
jgi:hypothetical protein